MYRILPKARSSAFNNLSVFLPEITALFYPTPLIDDPVIFLVIYITAEQFFFRHFAFTDRHFILY
jgi:hypothetical protein